MLLLTVTRVMGCSYSAVCLRLPQLLRFCFVSAERLVRADKIFRTTGFIKFLNIWFASQLSKVWGISLMHSEGPFKLAAWETERCFQVFPGGPGTEGKRKAGDELEVSKPSDSERSMNSVTLCVHVYACVLTYCFWSQRGSLLMSLWGFARARECVTFQSVWHQDQGIKWLHPRGRPPLPLRVYLLFIQ